MTAVLDPTSLADTIRGLLAAVTKLRVDAADLATTDDLYAAGLSSLATVDLMLSIEDHFEIEFTSDWLNRRTFASVGALAKAVTALQESSP